MDGGGTYLYQRLTYQKPQDDGVHGRKIPRETNRSSEATLLDEFASAGHLLGDFNFPGVRRHAIKS